MATTGPDAVRDSTSLTVSPPAVRVEHILLAAHEGFAGVAAMRWIADRAASRMVDVHVVDVVEPPGREPDMEDPRFLSADRTTALMKDYLGVVAPSVPCRTDVLTGDRRLATAAVARQADLLVIGTNRSGRAVIHFTPAFSTQMAETVTCPTVVVPRDWEPSDGPVVVGVEDDGSDDAAVEFAAREAETLGKEVVLVHAWRSTAPGASSFDADLGRTGYEAAAATRLMDVSRGVRAAYPGLPITPLLDHDKPASAVIRAAAGASLIVVGTHRMDALDRLRFSSVSRTVLERSRCPVAIVPPA